MKVLTLNDHSYPALLKEISSPPERLYVRGNDELLQNQYLLAVVGSRKASSTAQQLVTKLFSEVVSLGVPLVSGLAYGIDGLAHRLCVDLMMPTVAVLGSGIDDTSIYPRVNLTLAKRIIENGGAIISEYPEGTVSYKHHFPERNRIIAGLCRATVVVQAAIRSGSLITARLALEDGREVAAVPGSILDPVAAGTNMLIQQGATPLLNAQDVMDLIGLKKKTRQPTITPGNLTANQLLVLKHMSHKPKHTDELVQKTRLNAAEVAVILTELEMIEVVEHVGGMRYIRK